MICVIDNYDSFTYNLVQILLKHRFQVEVYKNDEISLEELKKKSPEIQALVISPGPGTPHDAGISAAVIQEFYRSKPILGICLGHQVMAEVFGAAIVPAKNILHGRTSEISHEAGGIYKNLPNPFTAMRYHSLIVETLPECLEKTAWVENSDELMGFRHREYPLHGMQFHPESVLTEWGENLVMNFFKTI